jgi:hypothetical protein
VKAKKHCRRRCVRVRGKRKRGGGEEGMVERGIGIGVGTGEEMTRHEIVNAMTIMIEGGSDLIHDPRGTAIAIGVTGGIEIMNTVIGGSRCFYFDELVVKVDSRSTVFILVVLFTFLCSSSLFIDKNLYTFQLTNCNLALAKLFDILVTTGLLRV